MLRGKAGDEAAFRLSLGSGMKEERGDGALLFYLFSRHIPVDGCIKIG